MRSCLALAAALALAGCGSARPPSDVDVVRGWTDALRAGHIAAADGFFALPVVISNGGPPLRLRSLPEVDFFDRTLPCGAVVIGTRRVGQRLVATFRLTNRAGPGAGCGSGVGGTAEVAFVVRDGHIAEWIRLVDPTSDP